MSLTGLILECQYPLWRLQGRICFFAFSSFWSLHAFLGSWPPSTSKPEMDHEIFFHIATLWFWLFCFASTFKKLHWAHLDNPGLFMHACIAKYSQFPKIRIEDIFGASSNHSFSVREMALPYLHFNDKHSISLSENGSWKVTVEVGRPERRVYSMKYLY